MFRREGCLRSVLVALGLLAGPVQAQSDGLTCRVRCSDTKLRTGIAELAWSAPAGANAATREGGQAVLDVTVFHDGFKRGLFQSFGKVGTRQAIRPEAGAARDAGTDARTQRAYDLILSSPEPSAAAPAATTGEVTQTMVIENLEPGLLYRFRLNNPGMNSLEVSCEAPVCPADMKEVK